MKRISMTGPSRIVLALLGATIYAAAGGAIGSMNAGWFELEMNANDLMPVMGFGAGLVVVSFIKSHFHTTLREARGVGRAALVLLIIGPATYVLSWIVDFAIIGTLTFAAGLVCLTIAVTRSGLVPVFDRILIGASAVGSFTWNTETTSAFLLVGVGALWMILSVRLLRFPTGGSTDLDAVGALSVSSD